MRLPSAISAIALSFSLAACAAASGSQTLGSQTLGLEAPNGAIAARPMPSAPLDESKTLSRVIFASCADPKEDQSLWNLIAAEKSDLVLFIGDNVYGDVRSNDPALPELKAAYMRLAMSEPFARVREGAPLLAVWDDHDYGLNDAGADFRHKEQSEALFDYVWAIPESDPRRSRPGVYGSWTIGEAGARVQVILLDTRFFRSPLKPTDEMGAPGKERYLPDPDPSKTMLGEAQWAWLAEELKKPAELRLLVSSIQVIAEGHGWEAWRALPAERDRLYAVIRESGAENVVLLSGDRHSAALYQRDDVLSYPLFEATSSSINLPSSRWRAASGDTSMEPGPYRLGDMFFEANYGRIDVDWNRGAVTFSIRNAAGDAVREKTLAITR